MRSVSMAFAYRRTRRNDAASARTCASCSFEIGGGFSRVLFGRFDGLFGRFEDVVPDAEGACGGGS